MLGDRQPGGQLQLRSGSDAGRADRVRDLFSGDPETSAFTTESSGQRYYNSSFPAAASRWWKRKRGDPQQYRVKQFRHNAYKIISGIGTCSVHRQPGGNFSQTMAAAQVTSSL